MPASPRPAPPRMAVLWLAALFVLLAGAETGRGDPAPASSEPAPVIERFHAALLDAMKTGSKTSYTGRETQLAPVVRETYDLSFMSKAALGRHWKGLPENEANRVVEAFSRMTIASYASQFASFSGERFETGETVDAGQGTKLVKTRIVEASGKATALDYRMRRTPAGWRAIDVFLDGSVSQLALHRADYSAVFERSGLPGLLSALDGKVKKLASGEESLRRR